MYCAFCIAPIASWCTVEHAPIESWYTAEQPEAGRVSSTSIIVKSYSIGEPVAIGESVAIVRTGKEKIAESYKENQCAILKAK